VRDGAVHGEAAVGMEGEGHSGLAGRRIVGGLLIKVQGLQAGKWLYLSPQDLVEDAPEGRYNFRHYGPVPLSFDPVRHLLWTYQGWQGQVYTRQYPENKFVQECLGEYCQYEYQGEPLFRTVGNDATFYCPPTANQLRRYLSQIPEDFQICFKVWEEITIPSYAKQPRYGARAGQPNPWFLDAKCSMSWY